MQLKLLDKKAKITELEAKATFMKEKQKVEQQTKMLQIQGEVARAKAGLECMKITHIFSQGPALKMRQNLMK